jgi:hypothetical protein
MNDILLQKNLNALKITNQTLPEQIRKAKKESWIEVNGKNFLIKKRNRIVSAYPLKESDKESMMIGKQKIYNSDCCTIVIGSGLGHLVNSILRNADKGHKIIIVEPVLELIKETFLRYDFSEWLKKGHLAIATTKDEVAFFVSQMDAMFVIQGWFIISEKYVMSCEEYADIIPYTMEVINQERCNTGTVMGAGYIIAENDIKNMPYCIRDRGVKDLKGLFKGKPAVTVNTGPSLEKNIYLLKEIQDNVIIIAVAQALRVLLAYDIRPDFICTVDYGEVNYEHFKGLMSSGVPLIALNRTYAPILKEWQGVKFITTSPSPGFENTTAGLLYDKGSIDSGGSVSHLAFGIAYHLGCNPITTIGLDLSYSNDLKSHIPQVDAGGDCKVDETGLIKWNIKDPRSSLKDKEHIMGNLIYVQGYFGESVPTNVGLASFITSFESIYESIHKKDVKQILIDSTEGGAKIKGSILMTLQKYIDTYANKKINKKVLEPLLTSDPESMNLIKKAIKYLEKDIELLDELIDNAKKGSTEANKMLKKGISEDDFKAASAANEKYANKAHEIAKGNSLIGVAIFHASRKIFSKEFLIDAVNERDFKTAKSRKKFVENQLYNNIKDRKKSIEKSKLILNTAKESAEKLKPMYQEVLDIFTKYLETNDLGLLRVEVNEKVDLSDAEKYFKAGNWAHPYVDAKKINEGETLIIAEKMRQDSINKAIGQAKVEKRQDIIDYNQFIEDAQKMGREEKKFKEALKLLQKAEKLFPKKFDARWGLASAYYHQKDMKKSIEYYQGLYEDFKEFPRVIFEYGIIMLENNMDKALSLINESMKDTHEFDYFLKEMGNLYFKSEKFKEAIIAYEQYKKSFPADYTISDNLLECYRKTGDVKKIKRLVN